MTNTDNRNYCKEFIAVVRKLDKQFNAIRFHKNSVIHRKNNDQGKQPN